MKIKLAFIGLLIAVQGSLAVIPVGAVRHIELPPQARTTLQNGVVTSILTLQGLDQGTWVVGGAVTVQDSVNPGVNGFFLYTYSALNTDPNNLPHKGFDSFDARPYGTWWFMINPVERYFQFQTNNDNRVYLIVESYGQVAPALSQAFGSILAIKISI